nr:beta-lactamase family protein [Actinomycetota bacterium]
MRRRGGRPWGVLTPLAVAALAVSACASARDSSENASAPSVAAPVVATTGATAALPEPGASSTTVPAASTAPPSGPSTTTTRPKPATTTTTTPPLQEIDWGVFDISLTDQIVNGGSRAASVAVALDGRIVHRGAYGQRVPGEALAPSDRFRVASISKPILSATVLRLVDEGELSLDKPVLEMVAQHLGVPLTDPRAARVTVRHLLAHTSGFGEFENELFYAGSMSCPHAASIAFAEPLDAGPGEDYLYSNMNFCLLGLVVEAAQDTPFQRVVQREVLRPIGVTDMRTAGTHDVGANDVLHDVAPGRTFMETLGAAGTWIATPSDIVKFGDSLDPAKPGAHPVSR